MEGSDILIKKLLILYTGGTFGMQVNSKGLLQPKSGLAEVIRNIPIFYDKKRSFFEQGDLMCTQEIECTVFKYKVVEFKQLLDSSNMTKHHILNIYSVIRANYKKYDCFIVLIGTDTMAYVAASLSYLFNKTSKSILLTGSQIPLGNQINDAYENLYGCLRVFARINLNEVALYFQGAVLRGSAVSKQNSIQYKGFESTQPELVINDIELTVSKKLLSYNEQRDCKPKSLSSDFQVCKLTPFFHPHDSLF